MPSLLILVPLLGIIILNLMFKIAMRKIAFRFALALFSLQLLIAVFHRGFYNVQDQFSSFFTVNLSVDSLTFVMLVCIEIVCLASLFVARYTLTDVNQRFNFINLLILSSIGMNGIVMTRDIFSLYVFLEIAAVSSFVLIAFRRGRAALEGAFKYIILSAVATILMLTAIALLLLASGDTSFAAVHQAIVQSQNSRMILFAVGIFVSGLFIKAGLVPFHGWLPDAYFAAPAPAAVLLAGIVTKVCGVYTLIRLVTSVFGFNAHLNHILLFVGAISVLIGALAALGQKDLKRMLAYSSISQVGYIILGLGSGTGLGLAGAVFHFFNHAIFKSLLFVNAAAVGEELVTTDMEKMGGLSSKMPITAATSVAGMLSAAGVPPFAGFWSKLIIIMALWQSGNFMYAVIAVLAGVLTLAYLLMMQRKVFFGKLKEGLENIKEANLGLSLVSIILAAITIGAGIFFPVVFTNLFEPVRGVLLR